MTLHVKSTILIGRGDALETLKNIVRQLRTEKGLSQGELAELVGVTRQTIISLEKGNYVPSLLLAMRLSDALSAPITEIFSREGSEP